MDTFELDDKLAYLPPEGPPGDEPGEFSMDFRGAPNTVKRFYALLKAHAVDVGYDEQWDSQNGAVAVVIFGRLSPADDGTTS